MEVCIVSSNPIVIRFGGMNIGLLLLKMAYTEAQIIGNCISGLLVSDAGIYLQIAFFVEIG
jgi:hypothetical protein